MFLQSSRRWYLLLYLFQFHSHSFKLSVGLVVSEIWILGQWEGFDIVRWGGRTLFLTLLVELVIDTYVAAFVVDHIKCKCFINSHFYLLQTYLSAHSRAHVFRISVDVNPMSREKAFRQWEAPLHALFLLVHKHRNWTCHQIPCPSSWFWDCASLIPRCWLTFSAHPPLCRISQTPKLTHSVLYWNVAMTTPQCTGVLSHGWGGTRRWFLVVFVGGNILPSGGRQFWSC